MTGKDWFCVLNGVAMEGVREIDIYFFELRAPPKSRHQFHLMLGG